MQSSLNAGMQMVAMGGTMGDVRGCMHVHVWGEPVTENEWKNATSENTGRLNDDCKCHLCKCKKGPHIQRVRVSKTSL